ncbi:hypothetical protein GCM10007916_25340 [Psychromonas marina]|uniref:VWFA domain-containing protein n=1 Tax=Psychromonas marina TaxID=88364 RepID=A0ABQ6E2C6_9GAMM|nr:vWA domain-containing protein [Psychromonas marina]GLS91465.1 hypothetical protein GCM10007916_25340 [Psychromonas marina]
MKLTKVSTAIALSFTLAGCGDSNSNASTETNTQPDTTTPPAEMITYQEIDGQLVVPLVLTETVATISTRAATNNITVDCPNVPTGYMPLNDAAVELHDALGDNIQDAITTDECGEFTFVVDETLVSNIKNIIAKKQGYKNIISDIDNFLADNAAKVVSTIESGANYEISSLKKSNEQSVNFIITDSVSNKAVIGLPSSAFIFTLADTELSNIIIVGSQNTSENFASVAVTLDASGSMGEEVRDENNELILAPDGESHTRYSLVAEAAHDLIDMTKANDPASEFSLTLFSWDIFPMTDTVIEEQLALYDIDENALTYSINSATNFIKEQSTLHTLIDLYNPTSALYNPSYGTKTDRHADRIDNIARSSYYPFGGSTAFYDSIDSAIEQLIAANVSKPMIIALTDGDDNASDTTVDDIITKANQYNIPVNIIGAGDGLSDYAIEVMKKITDETDSSYFDVTDLTELGSFLSGISTRVTFNYDAELKTDLVTGETLNIELKVGDEIVASRELLIP